MFIHGFPPVSDPACTVLVLGSMPSKASLRAGEYYAHPRNAFWKIAGALMGFADQAPYTARLAALIAHRIALWDVLETCTRSSSLDSDIVDASSVPNDFGAFFAAHPGIRRVHFNGAKAEAVFRRRVLPSLPQGPALELDRLPSTSPANAAITYAAKLEAWRRILRTD